MQRNMDIVLNKRPIGRTKEMLWYAKYTNGIIISKNPSLLEEKAKSLGITGLKIVSCDKNAQGRFCSNINFDFSKSL